MAAETCFHGYNAQYFNKLFIIAHEVIVLKSHFHKSEHTYHLHTLISRTDFHLHNRAVPQCTEWIHCSLQEKTHTHTHSVIGQAT